MAEEKQFENKVKTFLQSQGCWVLKTWSNGIQRTGIPDLLVCCNGYFLGVEIKASYGKCSELQKYNLAKIADAGGIAIVLKPKDFDAFKELIFKLKGKEWFN